MNQSESHRCNCLACSGSHSLIMCQVFLKMTASNRIAFANAKSYVEIVWQSVKIKDCKSSKRCFKCSRSHHTFIHRDDVSRTSSQEPSHPSKYQFNRDQSSSSNNVIQGRAFITTNQQRSVTQAEIQNVKPNAEQESNNKPKRNLRTIAELQNINEKKGSERETIAIIKGGVIYNLRALIDQCSDDIFIKASVVKMLGGKVFSIPSFVVTGLEEVVTSRVEKAMHIQMIIDEKTLDMDANIVPNLSGMLPKAEVTWPKELFKNIILADTNFATPNNVDIML